MAEQHKAKIKEIFASIQGEGPYVGVKQLFIRFCACNLNCDYCDTPFLPNNINERNTYLEENDINNQLKTFTLIGLNKVNENTQKAISLKERMQNTGKLLASAWVGTINKFSSLKTNAIAFGNKIKDSTIAAAKKIRDIGNTKVEFDVFKYNVSRLQNQPVSELRSMLSNELQGVTNE